MSMNIEEGFNAWLHRAYGPLAGGVTEFTRSNVHQALMIAAPLVVAAHFEEAADDMERLGLGTEHLRARAAKLRGEP